MTKYNPSSELKYRDSNSEKNSAEIHNTITGIKYFMSGQARLDYADMGRQLYAEKNPFARTGYHYIYDVDSDSVALASATKVIDSNGVPIRDDNGKTLTRDVIFGTFDDNNVLHLSEFEDTVQSGIKRKISLLYDYSVSDKFKNELVKWTQSNGHYISDFREIGRKEVEWRKVCGHPFAKGAQLKLDEMAISGELERHLPGINRSRGSEFNFETHLLPSEDQLGE